MVMQSVNPATGCVFQTYKADTQDDIDRKLLQTCSAFDVNKSRPFSERSAKIRAAADILRSRKDEFATLMTNEMGKLYQTSCSEIEKCADLCEYYAEHAESLLADEDIEIENKKAYIKYLPIGCVLAVMPWNFPFWQVFRFAVPTLMAGNVGVLKHASNVTGCALAIEEIFKEAGFSNHEFQALIVGSDKVADIIADDRIHAVTLTGSEKAGSAVAAQAGKHIKKSVLELGGSDPFIVMPSADIDKALELAVIGRILNNGQTCIAAKRYIIHADIYDAFKARLIERFESLNVGDPMDEHKDVGPLSSQSIRDELHEQVQKTLDHGASLLCGCVVIEGEGNYYQPGLLADIPKDSPAYKDELFGPVGLLFRVDSIEDAITLANDTRFGLGSVICSTDDHEIDYAVRHINAGATFVNALMSSDARLPFGGTKYSGYGRELSAHGLREFTNIKTIVME